MLKSWSPFYVWRKFFGKYELIDPRPLAKSAPYTFFLPTQDEIESLEHGDLVKLIFQSKPASPRWEAEKMWVTVKEIQSVKLIGILSNIPSDMPQLKPGDQIEFESFHIIDVSRPNAIEGVELHNDHRDYGDVPVGFLYREEPVPQGSDSEFVDSGWRIRGDQRGETNQTLDSRTTSFVAMGAVLNRDDSWLPLIDAPVGSRYSRDFSTGEYRQDMLPSPHRA